MTRSLRRRRSTAVLAAGVLIVTAMVGATGPAVAASNHGHPQNSPFVTRVGSHLQLKGKPFKIAGTNNYYLHYKSALMRDAVLDKAAAQGFNVVRTWGWFDIGNQDGSNSTDGPQNGVYLQYWDPTTGHPAYNDGPTGLEQLDAVIAKASALGIKLVIPFTGNWDAFGGMDQYILWAGKSYHDEFYSDPQIRGWYKDWIAHVLNRTNTITGVKYKDDPTVMTWELANEPRCGGSGRYPRSPDGCNSDTMTEWVKDISTYIKSIDRKQLVSVGDEGFFCHSQPVDDEQYDCRTGVDTERFARLKSIDVMSYHLYPDSWGKDAAWGNQWIREHSAAAKRIGKPAMLGEYGITDKANRNTIYKGWLDTMLDTHGAGALYWILSDVQDDGTLYPDYDGFTVYCPSPVCTTISNFGVEIRTGRRHFAPVADNDDAVVEFGESASLPATNNDIAYKPARVVVSSVDLDPATAGVQTTSTTAVGTWAASGGTVTFTPVDGWSGRTSASYVVRDSKRRLSNVATLTVNGKPQPGAALKLFDFEDGTQGWAGASFETNPGTTATTTEFASDGVQSLHIASNNAWFTGPLGGANWTGRSTLAFEMSPASSVSVSFQTGDAFTWCQIQGQRSATDPSTIEVDLLSAACGDGFVDVRQMNIFVSAGSVDVDAIRVL
jgi:mannan endo-1,4-beta-mannosidase